MDQRRVETDRARHGIERNQTDLNLKHVNVLIRAQVEGIFPAIKLDGGHVNSKIMREVCSVKESEMHAVPRTIPVVWLARSVRDLIYMCPAGWFIRNTELKHHCEPQKLPYLKLTGTLTPFTMDEYLKELKRGKHFIGNVNAD